MRDAAGTDLPIQSRSPPERDKDRSVRTFLALWALSAFLLAGCCFGGGGRDCDSRSHVGGCRGDHYEYCLRTSDPWTGEHEELMEGDCAANEVCVESPVGFPACVVAPATRCAIDDHVGRCDGEVPVLCMSPNSWVTDTFVVHNAPCTDGWHCVVDDGHASCVP